MLQDTRMLNLSVWTGIILAATTVIGVAWVVVRRRRARLRHSRFPGSLPQEIFAKQAPPPLARASFGNNEFRSGGAESRGSGARL